MKATGIVRRLDDLGRVVIPKELRRIMQIDEGDAIEIYTDADKLVLKKYEPGCVICGSMDNLVAFRGRPVCELCRKMIMEERKNG